MFDSTPKISRRKLLKVVALGSAASTMLGKVAFAADDWPNRPVTMVVPFGPGASNDIFTRQLSQVLTKNLGQPFVVDNRPGAGGFTATLSVSKSDPDGYRFTEMPSSIVGFGPVMGVKMDPLTDVTPVANLARAPGGMVIPSTLPVNSVQEFVDFAKARTEDTFVGFTGIGATQHQMAELFKKITGLKLKNVNYQSSTEATTDLIAGRLHVMFSTVAAVLGQIQGGQLKLLAYTNDHYPPQSPKAPTLAEAGVKGMEQSEVWWAIFGPRDLPKDITTRMNAEINKALDDPEFIDMLAKSGAVPTKMSTDEFIDVIKQEATRVDEFVKFTGIKPG